MSHIRDGDTDHASGITLENIQGILEDDADPNKLYRTWAWYARMAYSSTAGDIFSMNVAASYSAWLEEIYERFIHLIGIKTGIESELIQSLAI